MRKVIYGLIAFGFLTVQCDNASKRDTTKEQADSLNEEKFVAEDLDHTARFIVNTYDRGLLEIKAAEHMDTTSNSAEVKKLAKTVHDDNVLINTRLSDWAILKKVSLPDSLSVDNKGKHTQFLDSKTREKDYLNLVITENEKMITEFEQEFQTTTDTALKSIMEEALPLLRQHHKESVDLISKISK